MGTDLRCAMCGHPIEDKPDGATLMNKGLGQTRLKTVVHVCNTCHKKLKKGIAASR